MAALAYKGRMNDTDNLRRGWESAPNTTEPTRDPDDALLDIEFRVPDTLRFKEAKDFYVIDRFGSEIICVKKDIANVLLANRGNKAFFNARRAGLTDKNILDVLLKERLLVAREGAGAI